MGTCAYCDAKPLFRDHESGAYLCPDPGRDPVGEVR
jgi:hypothetical protein